jgi:molybdopterin molybdotransferase
MPKSPDVRALSVEEALRVVLEATPVLPAEEAGLPEAAGRVLREAIRADRDYPAFDKSLMDGWAVVAADLVSPPRVLEVAEEIPAGRDPAGLRPIVPGSASRIMTGAPLPPGADAVLIVEDSEPIAGDPATVRATAAVRPGDNLARRGADLRRGDVLLEPGRRIGAPEIAVLAACGRVRVSVGGRPRVAVLSTGDELAPPESDPPPGGIRNSNGPLLSALARAAGARTRDLGIARDDAAELERMIGEGLRDDALILSGGVSMGERDLVAGVLRALGVEILFEKVAIKPGRPFTFGRRGATLVFGCPGNPVSCHVVFEVFARPALRKMMGFPRPERRPVRAVLTAPVRQRPGRAGYHQARARFAGGGLEVEPVPTTGSADFAACARGNALAIAPADAAVLEAGFEIDVLLLDDHEDR